MLAKIIKIANIKKQREFIEKQLIELSELNEDGDISYLYTGYLFPEVRSYFEMEGFKIEDFFNETTAPSARFRTHHLFTISDELKLDDDDWNTAENFDYNQEDLSSGSEDEKTTFYNMLDEVLAKGIHPENGPHLVAIPIPGDPRNSEEIKEFLSGIFGDDIVSAAFAEKDDSKNSKNSEKNEDNIFNFFGSETSDEDNKVSSEFTGDEECYEENPED